MYKDKTWQFQLLFIVKFKKKIFYFSARGDGWEPALIGSTAEWKFVRELIAQRSISRPFMIGGSTNGAGNRHNIEFMEYRPDSKGKTKIHKIY